MRKTRYRSVQYCKKNKKKGKRSAKSAHIRLARKPSANSDQENAFKRKTHRRTKKRWSTIEISMDEPNTAAPRAQINFPLLSQDAQGRRPVGRGKREAGDSASGAREGGSCRVEWTSEIVVERLGSAETLTVTRSPAVLQTSARLLSETKTSQHHPRTSPRAPKRGASYFYEQSFKWIKVMF